MSTTGGVLQSRPAGPDYRPTGADEWVLRFGRTERFAHWWTVLMIAVALLSGLALGDEGSGPMLVVHAGAVVALGTGLVGALLLGDRRAVLNSVKALFVFDRRDRAWLAAIARRPMRRPPEPAWGMFNAGQKVLAWALTGSVAALIATGIASWSAGGEGGLHPTFAVLTSVLLGLHIFMAVLNPSTRHALNAMVRGRVRRSWAASHHAEWLSHAKQTRP